VHFRSLSYLKLAVLAIGFCFARTCAVTYTVNVDAAVSWGALPHFWTCFGTDHYGIFFTHPLIKDHITDCVQNLGMDKVRSHGMLADDIGIYKEVNSQPVYTWARADSVVDFFLSQGIRPVLEFGSMPHDLASNVNATSFAGWVQISSPPKDYTKWQNLITAVVTHFKQKYGAAEIEKWRYEAWNEPDIAGFWTGTEAQYQQLYQYTANGAKAADANIKIGGPTPSGPYHFNWVTDLLNFCKTNNVPIDCILFHTWNITDARNGHFQALDIANQFNSNLELINTEWGPSYQFNMQWQPQDNTEGSVCVANVICSIARRCHLENKKFPWTMSWWIASDIFEESGWNGYRDQPINTGNMGLISREGIYKPSYNVFKMLHMMGDTQVSISASPSADPLGVNGMATKKSDTVRVMLYNSVKDYGPLEVNELPPTGSDNVSLSIGNIASSKVDYRCMLVDGEHSNAYTAWINLGMPTTSQMTAANWTSLRQAMALATVDSAMGVTVTNKTFSRSFTLRKEGVMLVSLTPSPATAVKSDAFMPARPAITVAGDRGIVTIQAPNDCSYHYEVVSLAGRTCLVSDGHGSTFISRKSLATGTYLLRITSKLENIVRHFANVP
jgi:xylan 1,4-beta-xylosidase